MKLTADQFEEIIIYFTTSIHKKNTEEGVLWDLAKNCIAKLGFVDCVIYLVDHQTRELIQMAAYGPKNPKDYEIYKPVNISIGQGITGTVAQTGEAEIIPETNKDPRYITDDEIRFSEICVPIVANEEILGVIDCEHPEKNYYTQQHLRILKAIASICGIKLNQIRTENIIKTEQEKLLKVQSEMVDLKLKAFQSQMNPHFVFNTLNAIQYFITSDEKVKALNYLSVFSKLIRYYLKNFEKESIFLSDEIDMLNWYLKLQKLRYDNRFEYTISMKSTLNTEATIPVFVIQTLLENIIEFIIFSNKGSSKVKIMFEIYDKHVEVTVIFNFETSDNLKTNYLPEYRSQISKWQDQIRMLNKVKNYKIVKKVIFKTLRTKEIIGGKVKL
ncbi:MAG: histidine kinase, partial [Bacteroidetes bacterium]|nr:histidine kinase [Bacteroidota bacterium]